MQIKWQGHSLMEIDLQDGRVILTDPYDETVGYPFPSKIEADIVTVSHDHYDHNAVKRVKGNPKVIKTAGEHLLDGVKITGIPVFHDNKSGKQRGSNLIFIIEAEGLRLAHFGDLGHTLDEAQKQILTDLDVMMIPVGGFFTIDAKTAWGLVQELKPKYVIPMHYKTTYVEDFPISPVDDFLKLAGDFEDLNELTVESGSLPSSPKVVKLELVRL